MASNPVESRALTFAITSKFGEGRWARWKTLVNIFDH